MVLYIIITFLSALIAVLITWIVASSVYKNHERNSEKLEIAFAKVAQDALKNQQEQLLMQNVSALENKIEIFKAKEINPINELLTQFKASIDNYQKCHERDSLEIKNAISTAEKYARALTTSQNSKGEFGEQWLENVLNFTGLKENIHYKKQVVYPQGKPDFVIMLPQNKHLIIDSKVILKNYLEYCNSQNDESIKKLFIKDLTDCIINLGKKNYEEIEFTNQPGFILMFIPIESCINMIYTDPDFVKVVELANSKNIIITGVSSLIVTLRLINNLWTSQTQNENVQNIIETGAKLYNQLANHAQNLLNIQQFIDRAHETIHAEMKKIKEDNGSIFKEVENLRQYGIEAKNRKSGKKSIENSIPEEFIKQGEI